MRIEQYFLMSDYSLWEVTTVGPLVSATELNFTNSTNDVSAAGPSNAAMPNFEDLSHNADDVGTEADTNNMESVISVSPIPTTRIHKDHPISQIIGDLSSTTQTRSMARGVRDQGGISQMFNEDFHTYKDRTVVDGVVQPIAPTTVEQRLAKKNELKARGTLLMALPDKHQLKFNIHKDAKSLMETIEKSTKVPVFALPNVDNLSDVVIYSFFASQSNIPQLDNDDLKQIDADDLEEIDLKWQMAMLTMRAGRLLQRTGRNLGANEATSTGFDMSKVECYNCYTRGHFTKECRSPKNTRNKDTQRRNVLVETSISNALVSQCDGVGSYDSSFHADEEPTNYALMAFTSSSSSSFDNKVAPCLESVEARLVIYQQNENVFEKDIKLLKLDVILRDNALADLRKKFKKAKQKRFELKLKLENFQTSSKNLSKLLASQIADKTGLGYDNQVFNSTMFACDELISSESDVSMPTSLVHD
nr:hypothetical protein [Tanacetum cinerariifolium]